MFLMRGALRLIAWRKRCHFIAFEVFFNGSTLLATEGSSKINSQGTLLSPLALIKLEQPLLLACAI